MSENPAVKALELIDKALSQRPHKDDHALQAATKCLCVLRDDVIARRDEAPSPEASRRLEHVNGVISVVHGVHYPYKAIPWEELEKARIWLAALVGEPTQA